MESLFRKQIWSQQDLVVTVSVYEVSKEEERVMPSTQLGWLGEEWKTLPPKKTLSLPPLHLEWQHVLCPSTGGQD